MAAKKQGKRGAKGTRKNESQRASFEEQVKRKHGVVVDPGLTLERKPGESDATRSSLRLEKLAAHAPKETRYTGSFVLLVAVDETQSLIDQSRDRLREYTVFERTIRV